VQTIEDEEHNPFTELLVLKQYFFLIFPEGRIFNDINTQIM
jgi:hypothetical protein